MKYTQLGKTNIQISYVSDGGIVFAADLIEDCPENPSYDESLLRQKPETVREKEF